MNVFAKRLKNCRESIKKTNPQYTQSFVAEKIGVARTTYTAYENGTKTPPPETLTIIADFFDVTIDYLLGRNNEPRPLINKEIEEAEFQAFANNPTLQKWYKELPKSKEEDLEKLRKMWEIIKNDSK